MGIYSLWEYRENELLKYKERRKMVCDTFQDWISKEIFCSFLLEKNVVKIATKHNRNGGNKSQQNVLDFLADFKRFSWMQTKISLKCIYFQMLSENLIWRWLCSYWTMN